MTIDPQTGTDPCQVGRQRRYQSVLQLVAGAPIVSPVISGVGGAGEHDHLSARAMDLCSLPLGLDSQDRIADCPVGITWWTITAHGFEVIRENPSPLNPLPPLSLDEILARGRPCVTLHGRAILSDTTVRQTVRVFDIGHGSTFTWRGPTVDLRVLTDPNPALGGLSEQRPEGLVGNTIADTLVEYSASPVIWGTGLTQIGGLTFTQIVNVLPGVLTCLPIPEGARRVQWYQVQGPSIIPFWANQFGVAPTTVLLGGTSAAAQNFPQSVPGGAVCDLCFVLGGVVASQIAFVWELTV